MFFYEVLILYFIIMVLLYGKSHTLSVTGLLEINVLVSD